MPTTITIYPAKAHTQILGAEGADTQTLAVAVTSNPANNALYQYNLPEASSLHPATDLQTLFPGLKLLGTPEVETLHPVDLIKQYRPEAEQGDHLIIRSPGEEHRILNALAESRLLSTFSQLSVMAHDKPMYKNAQPAQATLAWLEEQGFELSARDDEDPDWPTWQLTRNPLQNTLDVMKEENRALTEKLQEAQNLLDNRTKEQERAQKSLEQEQAAHEETTKVSEGHKQRFQQCQQQVEKLQTELHEEKQQSQQLHSENQSLKDTQQKLKAETEKNSKCIGELEHQLEQKQVELAGMRQQLEQAHTERQQLQEQLANQSDTQNALKTLQERMDYLFGQNTLQLEQAANALGQHVSQTAQHTARELEAGLALQQQLGPDAPAPNSGESDLPKSAALQLARQLKSQPYDLIIELGSGANTHFMAHTLKNAYNNRAGQQPADQKKLSHFVEASDDDLPKRILSLEHSRSRYNQLNEQLKNSGLAGYVNLQFTPLVPFQYQGNEHLFYDCAHRLQHLSQLLDGRQASLLVMVNQPESGTGPDAQAALPALLQYLSAHKLEIVFNAQANPDLAGDWLNLMQERGLDHTDAKTFGAGPVQHITVNP